MERVTRSELAPAFVTSISTLPLRRNKYSARKSVSGVTAKVESVRTRRVGGGGASCGPPVKDSEARIARRERGGQVSVARVYADVNEKNLQEYWDYDDMHIEYR